MMTPRDPAEFKDTTFTPHRGEEGNFETLPPPPVQTKKDSSDPDWDRINQDIIKLCQRNGMARSALNLYLEGQLNWMEALETMVTALGKELLANQNILVDQRNEYLMLHRAHKELEASQHPSSMIDLPEEARHKEFFELPVKSAC